MSRVPVADGSRGGRITTAVVVIVGVATTLLVAGYVHREAEASAREAVMVRGERAVQVLRARLDAAVAAGAGVAALLAEDPDMPPKAYADRMAALTRNLELDSIRALNVARRVAADDVDDFLEREVRLQPDFDPRLADDTDEHAILHRLWPFADNAAALGFDLYANPDAGDAARRSLEADAPRLTDALVLRQALDREDGLVVYVPARTGGEVVGWASVVLQGQVLLDGAATELGVRMRVVDETPVGERLIGAVNGAVDEIPPAGRDVRTVDVLGQEWTVELALLDPPGAVGVGAVTGVGLVLTALLAGLVHVVVRSERRLGRLVDERTHELARANDRLAGTVAALESASRVKDDLVSAVSHELRTPLTVIRGFAQTLQRGVLAEPGEEARTALDRIDRGVTRLDRVVSGMFLTARLANGDEVPQRAATDVAAVVTEVVAERDDPAGPEIVVEVAAARALVDARHLALVVDHLLANALRYGRAPVHVGVREVGAHVELCVSDSGDGLPAEQVEALFDRFAQGDRGDQRRSSGLGLGLWVVREVADLNGGTVHYDAEPRPTFVVSLPAAPAV